MILSTSQKQNESKIKNLKEVLEDDITSISIKQVSVKAISEGIVPESIENNNAIYHFF